MINCNVHSAPSELKITDMRFVDIVGAPGHCTLLKLYTNQGLEGYGEVRDGSSRTYALMLKDRILGENPCNVDKIFRRIKQFGGHARQGGGVSGIEVALWDLAGKAYGVPIYQMLGGKFRDRIRMYCDTHLPGGRHTGGDMGRRLRDRLEMGYTFLKMDLGIGHLSDTPGTLSAPIGSSEQTPRPQGDSDLDARVERNRCYDFQNIPHPFTGIHVTQKGLDMLEEYVAQVREEIGNEPPLAIDHFGHIPLQDCIKVARRLETYSPAWLEDMLPWHLTWQYARLSESTIAPICTGEDVYLKEGFLPLLRAGGVAVVHPDVLTCGGILELKKIGDLAQEHGVAMAIHMAESPVACLAAVHAAAAMESFLALEYHAVDVPWWSDLCTGVSNPIVQNGFIDVPSGAGLGIESLNDDVLAEHVHPQMPGLWESTEEWNHEWPHDRAWS